jgi:hypothetical protein
MGLSHNDEKIHRELPIESCPLLTMVSMRELMLDSVNSEEKKDMK